jgi:MoaA/NifB/PqqE/SkfB family radical SAM enzyme
LDTIVLDFAEAKTGSYNSCVWILKNEKEKGFDIETDIVVDEEEEKDVTNKIKEILGVIPSEIHNHFNFFFKRDEKHLHYQISGIRKSKIIQLVKFICLL